MLQIVSERFYFQFPPDVFQYTEQVPVKLASTIDSSTCLVVEVQGCLECTFVNIVVTLDMILEYMIILSPFNFNSLSLVRRATAAHSES